MAPDHSEGWLDLIQVSPAVNGLVAREAIRHRGMSDREGTGVRPSSQRHTHFLDSRPMTHVLR